MQLGLEQARKEARGLAVLYLNQLIDKYFDEILNEYLDEYLGAVPNNFLNIWIYG